MKTTQMKMTKVFARTLVFPALACSLCLLPAQGASLQDHWIATWGTAQAMIGRGGGPGGGRGASGAGRGFSGAAVAGLGAAPARGGTGPQRRFGIPPALPTLNNQTARMVVHTSIGGKQIRVRLSNAI